MRISWLDVKLGLRMAGDPQHRRPRHHPGTAADAEISASAFAIAGVAPARGRHLTTDDVRAGAPPVIVIGHDEWQRRFAGDAQMIGRTLRALRIQPTEALKEG